MLPLDKALRKQLERTIKHARNIAEDAARAVLEQLGVSEATPFAHLSETERELRRKLRLHGRQLGDSINGGSIQSMERLVEETAYQHWHRMLFARFLAENNLLMYPDPDEPVAVSLEECEELAADEGAANGWELAARYAAEMLPQIFRLESPVFQLTFPPEHQLKIERLLADLAAEVFTASDSLGWVYQFWQADNKARINKSEVKIGARELPAVTQLFTEPYMVGFLLDNALGAWWAARKLTTEDFKNASSEEELRQKAAIPGVPLTYLRFVLEEDALGNKVWTPAAGTFDTWPEQLADLKTLDPSCGSGHFLVAALLMLVPMRMELDGLSAQEAVDAVLVENIHGLELDQRCVELAAFALAITAWKYPNAGSYRALPELNLACSGLSVSVAKEEWKQLGLGKKNLTIALDWMHDTFKDAPVLGSLLNPAKADAAKIVQWDELSAALEQALQQEQSDEQQEVAVVAQGLAKAAILLSKQYKWVITNVPYKTSNELNETLCTFFDRYYPEGKNALETVFVQRCMEFLEPHGVASIVIPQNPLFLISYENWRKKLLQEERWHMIARLGPGAFETITGEVVQVALITLSRSQLDGQLDDLFGVNEKGYLLRGIDASIPKTVEEKAVELIRAEIKTSEQAKQLKNPDTRITLEEISNLLPLGKSINCSQGIMPADRRRLIREFWESYRKSSWEFMHSTTKGGHFDGMHQVFNLELFDNIFKELGSAYKGVPNWKKNGVAIAQMKNTPISIYRGNTYDGNIDVVTAFNPNDLPAIWCFFESGAFSVEIRKLEQKLDINTGTIPKVPFDLEYWTNVAQENYPKGLPLPYTKDPTQWIFHGHPCGSVVWDEERKWTAQDSSRIDDSVLQVAVARLLGYRWPAELDAEMELADEQREWVNRCDLLLSYADADGIVCIPPVRGEATAASRLLDLLVASYGDAWSNDILAQLLSSASHAGKSLESWLRDKFFTQHCKLFQNRPFIWHVWDGIPDGFAALVNYHNLDYKTLETLIYTYLGDWISRQKQDIASSVDGAEEKLAAAEALKKKLELILHGEAPYDIFVRWKPLEEQPIGWHPDLNDGVRLNIRPFMSVPDVAKKGAGVLRDKPNIHWKKDRGSDVASAPWYHLGLEYGGKEGDRINDHHISLEEKRTAKEMLK